MSQYHLLFYPVSELITVCCVGQTSRCVFMQFVTSYPLRIPLALSCWTGSHETWISKAVSAVAFKFDGPTVGSVGSQWEAEKLQHATCTDILQTKVQTNSHVHFSTVNEWVSHECADCGRAAKTCGCPLVVTGNTAVGDTAYSMSVSNLSLQTLHSLPYC